YRSYNYGSVYYDTPYEPVYGSPYVVNYVYYGVPAVYGYSSNQRVYNVPQYGGYYDPYGYTPTYTSYASYASYPDYGYDAEYSAYDQYGQYDNGGGFGSLLGALPVGEIVSEITGNSVIGELLGGFLNQGYDEGYLAGEYARDNGFADEGY